MRAWAWAGGIAFLCCAAWAMPARAPAAVPVRLDPAEVRRTIEPALCLVTAENAWGAPVAVATGFLLGEGRFAVTDLGAVAQPGVARVTLTFAGGSTSVATEFGMADPALGLVALHVPRGRSTSPGLPLAPRLPALDGLGAVAAAGWRWGTEIEVVTGRVWRGPAIRDVAVRTRIETPVGVDAFLRMDGGRIDGASGSPVVGAFSSRPRDASMPAARRREAQEAISPPVLGTATWSGATRETCRVSSRFRCSFPSSPGS